MKLTKQQLNLTTNWIGGILGGGVLADNIPVESIVAWAYSLNPTVMALGFGVWTLFFAAGKETKD